MSGWTPEDLDAIDGHDEITVAGTRAEGSLRPDRIIWIVRVDDELYVRSVKGSDGAWYRGVVATGTGRITAGESVRDVRFQEVGQQHQQAIDAAYAAKYARWPADVDGITTVVAVPTTLRVDPR